ncbi:MAG TPA: hypothetical protein VMW35_21310 [Myxococcota bacterium]|jgi:hypothetical protein|nr:hypothetical protein [Myxococcota bacterium]
MKPCVFIHTNHKQVVGALVSQYSMRRASKHNDAFDVRILHHKDHPFLAAHEGQAYLRNGGRRVWRNDDLQSFTPLRFMPPEAMDYQGRALVVDPDIFAIGDPFELLSRDMQGKAILCRRHRGRKGRTSYASSVMLLDCAKLRHWRVEEGFQELFDGKRDYDDWICLRLEPPDSIGLLEREWNDFDRLTPETKMLHNTRRYTQPWKTGLPVDFVPAERIYGIPFASGLMRLRRRVFGDYGLLGRYVRHPDRNQERFFFGLLRECLERGIVTEAMLRDEMRQNHVRHDAFEVLARTAPPPA